MKAFTNLVLGTLVIGLGMANQISNEVWAQIVEVVTIGLGIIAAGGGVNVMINKLKGWLNFSGTPAYVLSWVVSSIVAIGGALIAGQITPDLVADWPRLLIVVLGILFTSEKQYRYQRDKRIKVQVKKAAAPTE